MLHLNERGLTAHNEPLTEPVIITCDSVGKSFHFFVQKLNEGNGLIHCDFKTHHMEFAGLMPRFHYEKKLGERISDYSLVHARSLDY